MSMRGLVRIGWGLLAGLMLMVGGRCAVAQVGSDLDGDGLSDRLEQRLLEQFAPSFLVARGDCSNVPAEFVPGNRVPTVLKENGTIYGQAFPSTWSTAEHPVVELHFYHLWARDCGEHGHHLDTEHVAVLVRAAERDANAAKWKATYWYAAAHEKTVCDVSQITRASTLDAEEHGAKVWISPGKHASFLNEALCARGCGADQCMDMVALAAHKIINLGETGRTMHGSVFVASSEWPLAEKMAGSNFPIAAIERVKKLPDTDIAWFRPGRHPSQQIIAESSATEQALAGSATQTGAALLTAGSSTDVAISLARASTGGALKKSFLKTRHALESSARHVGGAVGVQ